ncbi:MAG: rod shape-determining protein MreD [Syntrophomonadaceae bacterium]|nr:rod shape-determining protein MreD [Syntrophomonadaceae bacterium]
MRYLVLILIPYLSIFFETTFLGFYPVMGSIPDLVLLFVVFYAILNGSEKGAVYGFLCGLFKDLYLGRFIGLNAVSLALVALIVGRWEPKVYKENFMVGLIVAIAGTAANAILVFLFMVMARGDTGGAIVIFTGLPGQIIYNAILSIPLYVWYYRSSRKGILRLSNKR